MAEQDFGRDPASGACPRRDPDVRHAEMHEMRRTPAPEGRTGERWRCPRCGLETRSEDGFFDLLPDCDAALVRGVMED